jgi:hypothetical protein
MLLSYNTYSTFRPSTLILNKEQLYKSSDVKKYKSRLYPRNAYFGDNIDGILVILTPIFLF